MEGVAAVVSTFGGEGLLGRVDNSEPPEVPMWGDDPVPHQRERWVGLTHAVIDDRVAFRSSDGVLVDAVDVHIGSGSANVAPTLLLDVEAGSAGLSTRSFRNGGVISGSSAWPGQCSKGDRF